MASGSQCGFCTPGIVMSLYALLRNDPEPSELEIEEAFDGNLCRCTGYRPILDAAQSFNKSCGRSLANGGSGCCMESGGSCGGSSGTEGTDGAAKTENGDNTQPEKKFTTPDFIHYD